MLYTRTRHCGKERRVSVYGGHYRVRLLRPPGYYVLSSHIESLSTGGWGVGSVLRHERETWSNRTFLVMTNSFFLLVPWDGIRKSEYNVAI